ncbi:MAG: glycine cleavage system aminomethyltransferase GcvT [Nitrospira sp.]|nr:glycine cleavage system aminomethyltransferase GcvT [Nitrospira sp.]
MMNRTPLYETHRAAGAKLVDFAGWDMPIQYGSVVEEYQTVRANAGLFDVSHMGRLYLSGSGSGPFLQRLTTNDVAKLAVGQAHYSMMCREDGGILDDVFVYRSGETDFLLCVNASNREKIVEWTTQHHRATDQCAIEDRTSTVAQIAVQGPSSRTVLARLSTKDLGALKLHCSHEDRIAGIPCFVARTGYTGELGFELNMPSERATELWHSLLEAGEDQGMKPAGLGARDLLRLEMGYLLYGNDINEQTSPLEAGAEWTVSFQKGPFLGRDALLAQRNSGVKRRFVAFELTEKGVPRHGFPILDLSSSLTIGEVTSGNLSPLLQKGIGLGYVPVSHSTLGTGIAIDIRGKVLPASVVKAPFYKRTMPQG